MKKLLSFLLALVMLLSLAACTAKENTETPEADAPVADTPEEKPAEQENTQLVEQEPPANKEVQTVSYFCTTGAYLDLLVSEIDKWNQTVGAEKGVYIEITSNINDGASALEMQMQAGNYWDIMPGTKNLDWVLQGWVKDLSTIENEEVKALIASYEEYITPGVSIVGGILANIPMECTPVKMVVNKDLFEKSGLDYPKTWDDVVECAKIITEDNPGEAWGFGGTNWGSYWRRLLMKETASSIETFYWDPNTETYSFDQYKPVMDAVKEMYLNGWMLGLDDLAIDPIRAEFANGRVAMFPAPAYDWSVYTNQFPATCNWEFIDPPTLTEEGATYKGLAFSAPNVSICAPAYDNASPEKQRAIEEAWLFLCSDELIGTIYANAGMIPVKQSIVENTEVIITENVEQWEFMADMTNYALEPSRPDNVLPLEGDKFNVVFAAYVHGEGEWDEIVADLEERYNAAYQAAKADPDIDTSTFSGEWDHNLD